MLTPKDFDTFFYIYDSFFRYNRELFIAARIHWMARDNYVLLTRYGRTAFHIWFDRTKPLIFTACKRGKGFWGESFSPPDIL